MAAAVVRTQNRLNALPVKAKPKGPPADLLSFDIMAMHVPVKAPPSSRSPAVYVPSSAPAFESGGHLHDFLHGAPMIEEAGEDEQSTVSGRQR